MNKLFVLVPHQPHPKDIETLELKLNIYWGMIIIDPPTDVQGLSSHTNPVTGEEVDHVSIVCILSLTCD